MLRNKKVIKILIWQGFVLWLLCSYIIVSLIQEGTRIDLHTNDYLVNTFNDLFQQVPKSDRIVYLSINDNTYKDYFKRNQFDRKLFSEGIAKLNDYNPEAVILDLIFAYPSKVEEDSILASTLGKLNNLFLPVSFSLSKSTENLINNFSTHYDSELIKFLRLPIVNEPGIPFNAGKGIFPSQEYLKQCTGTGHISDFPDNDGIYRSSILIIKVDNSYLPSFYLSVFLNEINVPFENVQVLFGEKIIIPVLPDSWNNEIIEIPIDENGRTRIPYFSKWSADFPNLSLVRFNELANQLSNQGSLKEFFEGKFVFVCDVSTGIADIGTTSLNQSAPLVVIQSNMLNALLTNTFIKNINYRWIIFILFLFVLTLTISTFFYEIKIFYNTFFVLLLIYFSIIVFALYNNQLLPVISIFISIVFSFIVLLIQVQYITQKDKKNIEMDNLRKQHEMEEARKIQLSMLPSKLPEYSGLEIATFMSTASEVGGDYYDFYVDDNQNLKFVVADATGHGLKAGTMVTVAKTLFIDFKNSEDYLSVLNRMSEIIKQLNLAKLYLCLSLFKYSNRSLEFTSAGMPPVYWYKAESQEVEKLTLKGMPLGFVEHFPYNIIKINLNIGDTLLVSSDGLTELFNKENEMLDEQQIISLLLSKSNDSAENIITYLKILMDKWRGGIEPKDDITIIVIKIK